MDISYDMDFNVMLLPKQTRLLILSILGSVCIYMSVSLMIGIEDIYRYIKLIGMTSTVFVLCLSLVNYVLRAIRWHLYVSKTHNNYINFGRHFIIYLSGFALTTTPAKAGEVIRGVFLKDYKIPFHITLACLVSERISDLIVMLILCLLGIGYYTAYFYLFMLGSFLVIFAIFFIQCPHYFNKLKSCLKVEGLAYKIFDYLYQTLVTTKIYHQKSMFLMSLTLGIVAWYSEAYGLYYITQMLGYDVSHIQAIYIYAISMLVGALSFVPGGIGTSEAVMITLLTSQGMPLSAATAVTFFIRFATLWFAVIIGLICFFIQSLHKKA